MVDISNRGWRGRLNAYPGMKKKLRAEICGVTKARKKGAACVDLFFGGGGSARHLLGCERWCLFHQYYAKNKNELVCIRPK